MSGGEALRVPHTNDEYLERAILESDGWVAASYLFHIGMCQASRESAELLNRVADKLKNEVEFFKINPIENPSITQEMGVDKIPSIVRIYQGEIVRRFIGVGTQAKLVRGIRTAINKHREE